MKIVRTRLYNTFAGSLGRFRLVRLSQRMSQLVHSSFEVPADMCSQWRSL